MLEYHRIDYEVRGPDGSILFTSDNPDSAIAWADRRARPRCRLEVRKVINHGEVIYVTEHEQDIAS